jgi:hypothetical protein
MNEGSSLVRAEHWAEIAHELRVLYEEHAELLAAKEAHFGLLDSLENAAKEVTPATLGELLRGKMTAVIKAESDGVPLSDSEVTFTVLKASIPVEIEKAPHLLGLGFYKAPSRLEWIKKVVNAGEDAGATVAFTAIVTFALLVFSALTPMLLVPAGGVSILAIREGIRLGRTWKFEAKGLEIPLEDVKLPSLRYLLSELRALHLDPELSLSGSQTEIVFAVQATLTEAARVAFLG